MRIVIDMQGAQSASRSREIGRRSLALALAVARNAGDHELWLVLNGALGAAIEEIREAFAGLVSRERVRVFDILCPCAESDPRNSPRARASELLREYFIAQIQPDAVLVTSLFEGYADDAVVSVGRFMPGITTAVILHAPAPLPGPGVAPGTAVQREYDDRKIASLRAAGLLLATCDHARQQALDALGLAPEQVVTIATAADSGWDHSALRVLETLEQRHCAQDAMPAQHLPDKPRIAFVSPLPPARTGVADYAVRVLPTLLPRFEIDLIVEHKSVSLPPELAKLACRDVAWLRSHAGDYDHIVYQLGNNPLHSYMLPLLAEHPGVVVLHDFYLSSTLAYEQMTGAMPGIWTHALFASHGYRALQMSPTTEGWEQAQRRYPSNLDVLQDASHVIVHSAFTRQLAREWYGAEAGEDWTIVPLPRALPAVHDRSAARAALGIAPEAFVVCNFGFVAPTKHCLELVQAWVAAGLHRDSACELVFVGENDRQDYGAQLSAAIREAYAGNRIRITGWISDDDYLLYLQAADAGVQLRTGSRGETSGTALDCLIHGLPTILNANGSMAEFPGDAVCMLPDRFSIGDLAGALGLLRSDPAQRRRLGEAALAFVAEKNSPERCAQQYELALERAAARRHCGRAALYERLLDIRELAFDDAVLHQCARSIARARDPLVPRQLLVDVTAIAQHDLKTGIERVVRTQLRELLQLADSGLRVEPVYFQQEEGVLRCRYARRYAARLLGIEGAMPAGDALVDVQAGDIYYSGDHSPHVTMTAAREGLFANWRMRGVEINFVLYDLLPVLRPEFFPPNADLTHGAWLACIAAQAHRVICISAAVADELHAWLARTRPAQRMPHITSLHLGADIVSTTQAPARPSARAGQVAARPSFLMVGTIEPRKGHLQALDAFDQLWAAGVEVNLVVVGNEGWKGLPEAERRTIPRIVERLRTHPELGRRLLWLTGVDDDELDQIYGAASCLLAPSEGEGFGLPLIEAARHGLPILARELPVFREVGGDGAEYFSGLDGPTLAHAVRDWLARQAAGRHAPASSLRWMTWQENVRQLLTILKTPARRTDIQ
ncbi:glycosyltransferase [Telluria sp. B2]